MIMTKLMFRRKETSLASCVSYNRATRKNQQCLNLQQRLLAMEEEKNKFASLLTVVNDLETKLHKLKANNDVRMLKTKIEEQELIIKDFRNVKFHYDKLANMLGAAKTKKNKRQSPMLSYSFPSYQSRVLDSTISPKPWVSPLSRKSRLIIMKILQKRNGWRYGKIRHKLLAASYTQYGSDIEKLFREIDVDHNGTIDMAELEHEVRRLLPHITDRKIEKLMKIADVDGSGMLDLDEFKDFICHRKTLKTYSHHHEEETKPKKDYRKNYN